MSGKKDDGLDVWLIEDAKTELKALEIKANLPLSASAVIVQLSGMLWVFWGLFAIFQSVLAGLVSVAFGGFILALGRTQQVIFDIRTLKLRELAVQGMVGLTNVGKQDA
ncbi:MAG: hypothetical protein AB7G24_07980 [Novosphingobium sp.]